MLTHVLPDAVGAHVASLLVRSDSAVDGTPNPGLSGWLYERYWIYDMPAHRRVHAQSIHEAIASGVNIMMWDHETRHAPDVVAEADALATAQAHGIGHLKSEDMQLVVGRIFELNLSRTNKRLRHGCGEGNPLADAGSRGYFDVIATLGEQLGLRVQRVPLTREALECGPRRRTTHSTADAKRRSGGDRQPTRRQGCVDEAERVAAALARCEEPHSLACCSKVPQPARPQAAPYRQVRGRRLRGR